MTETKNIKLQKPKESDYYDVNVFNNNFDAIDEASVPRISWEAMDTFNGEIAVVTQLEDVANEDGAFTNDGVEFIPGIHSEYKCLLIQYTAYETLNGSRDNVDCVHQILCCNNGTLKTRYCYEYGSGRTWSTWTELSVPYTTAEKAKLTGIEEGANKYTHPESHSADMITETATKRFTSDTELSGKVDAVDGKGLSSNDYTDEDKAKVHEHANKAILDAITDAPISDAPSDSSVYGRKNGAWSKILQSLPEVAYADLDDFCPINDDDSNFGTYTGIYKVYKTDDGSENFSWGQIPYRNRDAYVLAVSEYSYDNNVTCTQTLYGANALPRQRVKQIASGSTKSENEWTDWSAVTYTKYEINQLINPTVKNTLTSPITANTIYNLGKQTALTITLPSASVGKFVQFDFVSGSAATTLTVNSSSGLTDFDLIPAANTVYSLYFDWGATGYSGTSVTYGWRFSYSEYPIASV